MAWDITSSSRRLVFTSYSEIWILPWWMKFQQEALKTVVSLLGRCSLWMNKATSEMPLLVLLERPRPWFSIRILECPLLCSQLFPIPPIPFFHMLPWTEASRRREKVFCTEDASGLRVLLRKVLQLNMPRCLILEPVFWAPLPMWTYQSERKPLLGELSSLGFVLSLQTLTEVLEEVTLCPSHSQLTQFTHSLVVSEP